GPPAASVSRAAPIGSNARFSSCSVPATGSCRRPRENASRAPSPGRPILSYTRRATTSASTSATSSGPSRRTGRRSGSAVDLFVTESLGDDLKLLCQRAPSLLFLADVGTGAVRRACAFRGQTECQQPLLELRVLEVRGNFAIEPRDDLRSGRGGRHDREPAVHNHAWNGFAQSGQLREGREPGLGRDRQTAHFAGLH